MGVCNMFLLTQSLVKDLCTVHVTVPKKRSGPSGYDRAREKFFLQVLTAIASRIDFTVVQCVVVAGPGFTQGDFHEWMMAHADEK